MAPRETTPLDSSPPVTPPRSSGYCLYKMAHCCLTMTNSQIEKSSRLRMNSLKAFEKIRLHFWSEHVCAILALNDLQKEVEETHVYCSKVRKQEFGEFLRLCRRTLRILAEGKAREAAFQRSPAAGSIPNSRSPSS